MTTTTKQAEANRRNAANSTGPRSEDGKKRSALNALQHGMTAETPTLPTEDPGQYDEFRTRLTRDLAPEGAIEERLVEEIVDLSWRLRRASNLELGVLAGGVATLDRRLYRDLQRKQEVTQGDVLSAKLGSSLDEVIEVVNEDAHDILSVRISETEDVQRSDEVRLASAFVEDAAGPDAFARLSRYETSLFRRRNQALQTLSKLQAQRHDASPKDSG
jgi:hypothetical protein